MKTPLTGHAKNTYPFLEYSFTGDSQCWRDPLVGSAIRAIGKKWRVAVLARDEGSVFWKNFASAWKDNNVVVFATLEDFLKEKPFPLVILDSTIPFTEQELFRESKDVCGQLHVLRAGDELESLPYNLISRSHFTHKNLEGVWAFTGTGKGKTTSALGWAWQRAEGKPVAVIQWFKEKSTGRLSWAINEHFAPTQLKEPQQLAFYPTGLGFFGSPALDRVTGEQAYQHHRQQALQGLALAGQLLREKSLGALVLDEFVDTLQAVSQNLPQDLLRTGEVQALLRDAVLSKVPVAVSGRRVTPEWEAFVAASVEIENIRHPWTHEKRAAVSGLDY